jgi:hypothetical protein
MRLFRGGGRRCVPFTLSIDDASTPPFIEALESLPSQRK